MLCEYDGLQLCGSNKIFSVSAKANVFKEKSYGIVSYEAEIHSVAMYYGKRTKDITEMLFSDHFWELEKQIIEQYKADEGEWLLSCYENIAV